MTTADQVIRRFESQVGIVESPLGSNFIAYNDWYFGYRQAAPWCATFLSWCFFHEGLPLPATISRGFAYTPSGAAWFKNQGRWTSTPKRGHVVFFDFPNDGVNRISHVGIVTAVNPDGSIQTVEGNTDEQGGRTGGKVMRRTRSVGIVGYGVPAYTQPQTPTKVTDYLEDKLRSHQMRIELGDDGTGWAYAEIPKARIVNAEVNGMNIEGKADTGRAIVADSLAWSTGSRITLRASKPGRGAIDLTVWEATG